MAMDMDMVIEYIEEQGIMNEATLNNSDTHPLKMGFPSRVVVEAGSP